MKKSIQGGNKLPTKMSVLSCDRRGCTNIMCDRHSYEYGYICNECFEELCQKHQSISKFMDSEKREKEYVEDRWFEFCDKEFIMRSW